MALQPTLFRALGQQHPSLAAFLLQKSPLSQTPHSRLESLREAARVFDVSRERQQRQFRIDYTFTNSATDTIPGGGASGLFPKASEAKTTFDAGEDDPVRETDIQKCIDTAKELRLQIKTVFADGTMWKPCPATLTHQITLTGAEQIVDG